MDWDRSRIRVSSPKTEHHEGKDHRWIPIFPELRPYLDAVWEAAEPGAEWVITRYRDAAQNLRTQLNRIIRRAGLEPWPKLWQNLRSTRETELAKEFPIHVVCEWIGNSAAVAAKHYLQVTDADYEQAAQKAAQQAHAESRNESQAIKPAHEKAPVLPELAAPCESMHKCSLGGTGLEPVTSTV